MDDAVQSSFRTSFDVSVRGLLLWAISLVSFESLGSSGGSRFSSCLSFAPFVPDCKVNHAETRTSVIVTYYSFSLLVCFVFSS